MDAAAVQTQIDFGLVVLIWMVQLIVYPSFLYYDLDQLPTWHTRYTSAITVIVLPLMVTQVLLHGWGIWTNGSTIGVIQALMIVAIWGLTFLKAVPLHDQIQVGKATTAELTALVGWNWPRTALWTVIYLLNFMRP